MVDDATLLRRYAEEHSEDAFAELVRRHLNLVYGAALRRLAGDAHAAADVAQQVFTTLAREAAKLSCHPALPAWLYTATRHAALDAIREARRRRVREQEALIMHELVSSSAPEADWEQLRPVLDEAIDELAEADRTAVLLRYFEQRPFAEVGAALRTTEDAARMRTDRALAKLRALLAQRQITSTTAALALALTSQPAVAVPAGLAVAVTSAAMAGPVVGAVAAAGSGAVTATGIFAFMSTTSIAPTLAVLAALVAIGAATYSVQETRAAEAAFGSAEAERVAAIARLHELQARAAADTPVPNVPPRFFRASVASTSARPATQATDSADTARRLASGREFLAAHPEMKPVVDAAGRLGFEPGYGARLRAAGLSAAERELVKNGLIDAFSARMRVGELLFQVGPENGEPLERSGGRLQELLGADEFQRYGEAQRKELTHAPVKSLAVATCASDTPLLPAQAAALAEIIDRHSAVLRSISGLTMYAVDWPAVASEAAQVLSSPQLELFNVALRSTGRTMFPQIEPRR